MADSERVMELFSQRTRGANENLISSSKPLKFRRSEGMGRVEVGSVCVWGEEGG